MGNGTCDLDSAVCALVQGYLEYLDTKKTDQSNTVAIIPLMNIPRREYCIKTEVVYSFKCHTVSPDLLTFRDEIDLKELKDSLAGTTLEVVLVDHHALPEEDTFLTDSVIRVIDHRPRDANWSWHHRDVCIEPVGSCASLVTRRFLDTHPEFADCRIGKLLRGPILVDTFNLSEKTERTTPIDIQSLERLEHLVKQFDSEDCQLEDRNTVYSRLIQARNDISELSLDDLLIKDVKVMDGVPIVGMPMLIRKFITAKPSPIPYDAICNFAVARNTRVVVLLGMLVEPNEIRRDFALFSLAPASGSEGFHLADDASLRANEIFKQMYDLFMADPCLRLRNESPFEDRNGKWEMVVAEQTNLSATRKHLVKIFRDIIEKIHDFKINNQSRPKWVEERLACPSSS
ncbi:exopolyphosphatase PRUNE1-like isoform X2 [Lasioglossum baleicum]